MDSLLKNKMAFFLPNIFTALNMGCGFSSIMFAIKGDYYKACMVLFLGALFDSVDGRLARIMGSQSSFGEQFDSLSDLISFGMAPAIMFYMKFLAGYGRAGMVFAFFFMLCAALRLARFNANLSKINPNYFQGLPSPGAAMGIISFVLVSLNVIPELNNPYISFFYIAFYSLLMVSSIPFPSFKNSAWIQKRQRLSLFIIMCLITFVFLYEEVVLSLIISSYVSISMIYFLINYKTLSKLMVWDEEAERA